MAKVQNKEIPFWIERLWSDCDREASADKYLAVKLLDLEGRKLVWWVCKLFGVLANGIPGQACQLVERCISVTVRRYAHLASDSQEWHIAKQVLKARVPLLIVASVQLSAKMSSAQLQMNASTLRERLMDYGIIYSVEDIKEAEMDVFQAIGFRVPLWTSLETAQMLATEAGMSTQFLKGVALITDLCEYYRHKLQDRLRWAAFFTQPSSQNYLGATGNLRSLHLAAGTVAATARYLRFTGPDPIPLLANITRAPQCYIKCICDIILSNIIQFELDKMEMETPSAKRRKN